LYSTIVESKRHISHTEDRNTEVSDIQSIVSARTGHSMHSPVMPVNTTLASPIRQSATQQASVATAAIIPKGN
jgi:hypothetical protein